MLSSTRSLFMMMVLALAITSCSKGDVNGSGSGSNNDSLASATYLDVSYGTDAKQKVDLYLPSNRSVEKTKTIVIVHGGGWTAGDKRDFSFYISEFQKRLPGYAFANVNYRLATTTSNFFPAQENDMSSAIRFLQSNAAKYVISNDLIFLGVSAGAQLSLLQGYKHSDQLQPRGIVSYFGPTDLERLYTNSDSTIPWVLRLITNANLESNPQIFLESSPINYVSAKSAPTLLLHGDQDKLVPLEQAELLRDKLVANGVPNNLIVYPGQGHDGWTRDALLDSFDKVEAFIKGL